MALVFLTGGALLWHRIPRTAGPAPVATLPRQELTLRDGRLYPNAGGAPFTGIMFESDRTGRHLTEVPVKEGYVHGLARGWHVNGHLEVEEAFVDGVSDGVRRRWYPNGQQRNAATIVRGVLEGAFTEWHENGQLATKMNLVAGKGEGLCESWDPDGRVKSQVRLKNGVPAEPELLVEKSNP